MTKLSFRPRATFNADLKRLGRLDPSIIDEVREAIDEILETGKLPAEYVYQDIGNFMFMIRLKMSNPVILMMY